MERVNDLILAIIKQDNETIKEILNELNAEVYTDTNADYKDDGEILLNTITIKPRQVAFRTIVAAGDRITLFNTASKNRDVYYVSNEIVDNLWQLLK